jgi:hypothetical protein
VAKQNDFDASICVQDAEFGKKAQWQFSFFFVAKFSHFVKNYFEKIKIFCCKVSFIRKKNWPKVATFTYIIKG